MNKIIKVNGWQVSDDIRKSIKRIVDQMEQYNFAISSDSNAVRLFSFFTPEVYKKNGTIIISRTSHQPSKGVVTLNPDYIMERIDDFSFKIKIRR